MVWRRTDHASQTIVVSGSTAYVREMNPTYALMGMTLLYLYLSDLPCTGLL